MGTRFDQFGRDGRSVDQRQREETAGPAFTRWFVRAFGIAAALGLLVGLGVVAAGLWHFHVRPLW
ncbi:MAG: hypothetical protein ABL961_13920 [Vicinamibacterales bacterium]|jgi:hypothetical protein